MADLHLNVERLLLTEGHRRSAERLQELLKTSKQIQHW